MIDMSETLSGTSQTQRAPIKGTPRNRDLDELAVTLDRLAAAFGTLSAFLLKPPTAQVLDQVRQPELLEQWPCHPCTDREAGINLMLASRTEDELAIRDDFNRLFVGPERMLAAPYESVHLSADKLIFEQQTFVVRAAYAQFDLAAPRLNQDPDDHIGLELEFLAALANRALDILDSYEETDSEDTNKGTREAQVADLNRHLSAMHSFLSTHLLAWGDTFFSLVQEHAQTEFFRGVGTLGHGVLDDAANAFSL